MKRQSRGNPYRKLSKLIYAGNWYQLIISETAPKAHCEYYDKY